MRIREAKPSDVAAIFRIRTSVDENYLSEEQLAERSITPALVAEMLDNGAAGAWCAEVAGEVVGFSMAREPEHEIFALFVLPAQQGSGLGSALLDRAVHWLDDRGARPIRLSTGAGTAAVRFYTKRGWHVAGTGAHGDVVLELPE